MNIAISGSLWLNIAISVVLPMLVALVTARTAHPGLKAILLLALSAVSGFLVSWLDALDAGQAFDLQAGVMQTMVAFGMAVLAHYGLLKPMSITGAGGKIQVSVPGGVGKHSRIEG